MIAVAKTATGISPEEYLEGEKRSEIRHEYVGGRVFAMAGASGDHNRIAGNIFGELFIHLRGSSYEPFMNDMKLRMPASEVFYYPDVMVVCDPSDNAAFFRERPAHIFEVISPETERTDRREKMLAYRDVPGLKSYILLEQDQVQATITRSSASRWSSETIQGFEATLSLPDLNFHLPLGRIYERTALAREQTKSTS